MKWLLVLAVFCVAAAYVTADTPAAAEPQCGILERVKVKRQWIEAFGESEHRLEFALHYFNDMFKKIPKMRELFTKFRGDNVYSPVFQAHAQRLFNAFGMLITSIDDMEVLKILGATVKKDMIEWGIQLSPEFIGGSRDEMLTILSEYLTYHIDWDAWQACLDTITDAVVDS